MLKMIPIIVKTNIDISVLGCSIENENMGGTKIYHASTAEIAVAPIPAHKPPMSGAKNAVG